MALTTVTFDVNKFMKACMTGFNSKDLCMCIVRERERSNASTKKATQGFLLQFTTESIMKSLKEDKEVFSLIFPAKVRQRISRIMNDIIEDERLALEDDQGLVPPGTITRLYEDVVNGVGNYLFQSIGETILKGIKYYDSL